MSNEIEPLKQDIEATRSSLVAKVEAIQEKLTDTVTELPQTVQTTVQEAVQETVEQVQQTIGATTDSVKQALDLKQQVQARPWTMLGASFALGLVLGSLADDNQRYHAAHNDNARIADTLNQEFTVLKQAAWATMQTVVRDAIHQYVPNYDAHAQRLGVADSTRVHSDTTMR
jgi:ElaB/YqjD/DUF883 family membrane-anchored ribosome-binding protein